VDIQGCTFLLTGSNRGIGHAIASRLAREPVRLLAGVRELDRYRPPDPHGRLRAQVQPVRIDLSSRAAIEASCDDLDDELQRVDVLVNNAGAFARTAAIEDVGREEFNEILAVNLAGAFWCTQHAVRAMKKQQPTGGRIVNIGSVSAQRPRPNSVAYAISKHGMTGLTRATALEGRDFGITCTQIDVGNATTAMSGPLGEPTFDPAHIGTVVATLANLPLDVSIPDLTMLATHMPYLGRS
jgi:NAD(P)-dependent dehydrogenase (short-subunit alcohol dehydrogenase family)